MDLITAYLIDDQWVRRVVSSALPSSPVVPESKPVRNTSSARAAVAAVLLRASRAVAPA
jgi:hypothetical protein